ncbi:hypothetical protein K502DRAFT_323670 [Neoconidiobolus thromboides FSU 785]|nr:hypothetical protein K502DRAFT_323670 [Neoconidiobolus thromboides FSU 785]
MTKNHSKFIHHDFEIRRRIKPNESQRKVLEKVFASNPFPTKQQKDELSELLKIPEANIQIWFQNRRVRSNKESSTPKSDKSESSVKPKDELSENSDSQLHYESRSVTFKPLLPELSSIKRTPNYLRTDPHLYKLSL